MTFHAEIVTLPVPDIFEEFYLRVQFMASHPQSQNGHRNLKAKKNNFNKFKAILRAFKS